MTPRTCRYFFALLLSLLTTLPCTAQKKEESPERFFQGVYVSADLFGYVLPVFTADSYLTHEVSVSVNLRNRFLPTAEVGYGSCNTTGELYGIRYSTAAPYLRVGLDYNTQYKKGLPSYLLAGIRVGMSRYDYTVDGVTLADPVWGTATPLQIEQNGCSALWGEGLIGVRAQIWRGFHMGWTVRYRLPIAIATGSNGNPWYVPGYGVYGTKNVGATYNLTYYFHLK